MDKRRLALMVLCALLIAGPIMVPLSLYFSNATTVSQLVCLTNYSGVNWLSQQNSPISAKDLLFSRDYSNLSTETPLRIELTGVPQIERVYFNLSGITAPNYTIRTEEQPEKTESIEQKIYVMSFKVEQSCYLYNLSLQLVDTPPDSEVYVDFDVYNATWNQSELRVEPNESIYLGAGKNDYNLTLQTKQLWKTITFNPALFLNSSETENQTFFIALGQDTSGGTGTSRELIWGYTDDDVEYDYGPAYENSSGKLNPLERDFSMRVYVCASINSNPELPFPSQIKLIIKETNTVWQVQNYGTTGGEGVCNITGNLGSSSILTFTFNSTWFSTASFNATVEVHGTNLFASILITTVMTTLFAGYSLGSMFQSQTLTNAFLILAIIGAVAATGAFGYKANKKRMIPINAMKNMESILVDHKPSGTMIWSFDFISMQQDVALVSGFMSAIKSFLEEMKVGGLKRLGTEFGTFIREETQMLTATCIAGEIGLDEEFWIRSKLHEFLIKIEQNYHKELVGWKGDVAQFRETFPTILSSLINLDYVQKLQRQKMEKLARNKDNLQKNVNKYGAKLEDLKSRYDSGELDFKKYIIERYKTEAKYDKVQKDYLYAGLFLSRAPSALEKKVTPKELEKMENLQNRFLEVRKEIEKLQNKELKGTITSQDIELREKLQKELMSLIEKLDKLKE